jgi:hypothetical protein
MVRNAGEGFSIAGLDPGKENSFTIFASTG